MAQQLIVPPCRSVPVPSGTLASCELSMQCSGVRHAIVPLKKVVPVGDTIDPVFWLGGTIFFTPCQEVLVPVFLTGALDSSGENSIAQEIPRAVPAQTIPPG